MSASTAGLRPAVCYIGMFLSNVFFKRLLVYGTLASFLGAVLIAFVVYVIPKKDVPKSKTATEAIVLSQPLTAHAWALFDTTTGEVIGGEQVDTALPIASITKLFTAFVVMHSPRKDEAFSIRESDVDTNGRAGKLSAGEIVTPYTLLFPLLIESSNDAGVAIARYLDREYVQSVNNLVTEEGLTATHIVDPSGLSADNVSTPRELARFFVTLKHTYPHTIDITRLRMYIGTHSGYVNNNPASALSSFRGGKHGYTDEAGRTFIGTFELHEGKEIGIVLLGSSDLLHDISILEKQGEVF